MYASGLSSHRNRIKKIKGKKAHLGCFQGKRFQRPPLLFFSHLMPDSIANRIIFTFKTYLKSSHCPPPLHNQSYTSTKCSQEPLPQLLKHPGFHLCAPAGDYLVRTTSSEYTPGPIAALLKTLRDFLSRSGSKLQSLLQAHDLASWRGGWSHPLIHSSCSVLPTTPPFSPHSPCTSHSLLATFFLQIVTRCLSSLLPVFAQKSPCKRGLPWPNEPGPLPLTL